MGSIEDIYADTETDVSEAEFREAVEQKVDQMEGLADEETAAMIISHELADSEVETVADIEAAMDEVKFIAEVTDIGDLRTFERDDGEGTVVNVDAADETGHVRLAFWDEGADAIDSGEIEVGDTLRVKGRPKDGYTGLEVSVDQAQVEPDVDVEVASAEPDTIEALSLGDSDMSVRGLLLDTDSVRTFDRDDGSEGRVSNLTIGDESGRIRVTLWDERADRAPGRRSKSSTATSASARATSNSTSATTAQSTKSRRRSTSGRTRQPSTAWQSTRPSTSQASSVPRTPSGPSTATTARRGRSAISGSRTKPATSASPSGGRRPTGTSPPATKFSPPMSRYRTAGRTTWRHPRAGSRQSSFSTTRRERR